MLVTLAPCVFRVRSWGAWKEGRKEGGKVVFRIQIWSGWVRNAHAPALVAMGRPRAGMAAGPTSTQKAKRSAKSFGAH
jgi:hypothetical protein